MYMVMTENTQEKPESCYAHCVLQIPITHLGIFYKLHSKCDRFYASEFTSLPVLLPENLTYLQFSQLEFVQNLSKFLGNLLNSFLANKTEYKMGALARNEFTHFFPMFPYEPPEHIGDKWVNKHIVVRLKLRQLYKMLCATWYHLCNLKNVQNISVQQLVYVTCVRTNFIGIRMILDMRTLKSTFIFPIIFKSFQDFSGSYI